MGAVRKSSVFFLVLAVLGLVGCGSGGDLTSSRQPAKSNVDWSLYPKGPTRQFIVPGGDNAVQTFGREATTAERRQASTLIASWMRARAAEDWAKDCSYFDRLYARELADEARYVTKGEVTSCPGALAFFGPEASGDLVNTMSEPIASLRVGNGHGYAQYHGDDGKDWIVPVDRENGVWKVAIAAPVDRLR